MKTLARMVDFIVTGFLEGVAIYIALVVMSRLFGTPLTITFGP